MSLTPDSKSIPCSIKHTWMNAQTACNDCLVNCRMHGGAGALMSIGLMERLPLSFMDRCMKDLTRSSGGDALISVCLWRAGYAFTDPGYSFYHWEAKSFDPGPENSTALLAYLEDAISNNSDQYSLVSNFIQKINAVASLHGCCRVVHCQLSICSKLADFARCYISILPLCNVDASKQIPRASLHVMLCAFQQMLHDGQMSCRWAFEWIDLLSGCLHGCI